MNNIDKSLAVAKKLGIKVVFLDDIKPDGTYDDDYESRGRWNKGSTILINRRLATNYTVLHEIGHVFNGYMCCREHCEYAAHGAAIMLAKVFDIRLHPKAIHEIDVYAGRSARKACGAIEQRNKK